jgi:hypothetical protein
VTTFTFWLLIISGSSVIYPPTIGPSFVAQADCEAAANRIRNVDATEMRTGKTNDGLISLKAACIKMERAAK